MAFLFLFRIYFILYDNLKVHPRYCQWHYFILLMADGILMAECIVYMYCILFTHSSADADLGCLHVSATANSSYEH